ncbi:hypothetical protein BH10PSE18_BH10PSE18_26780 [soil metagenome]
MSVLMWCIAFSVYGVLAIFFLSLILTAGRADNTDRRFRRAMKRLFRMRQGHVSQGQPPVGA